MRVISEQVTRFRLHLVLALLATLGILPGSLAQTYSALQTSSGISNSFDNNLSELRSAFAQQTGPAQAATLGRAYDLRQLLSDPSALNSWFEKVAGDNSVDGLVRDEALRYAARMDAHMGNLDAAQSKWDELGLVRQWTVVGPFVTPPADATAGFAANAQFKDRGAVRVARAVPEIGPVGSLDISELFPEVSTGIVLASATVHSDTARTMSLRFGADGPATIFVNGKQVFASDSDNRFSFDQRVATVDLNAGENSIVLALRKTAHPEWRLSARLSSTGGDIVQRAKDALDAQPNSADALDVLGILQQSHGRDGALDSFEEAVRLSASTDRWLRVASACADTNCTFTALNAARALSPNDPAVARQLVDYYLGRNQTQKARSLLTEAIAAAPGDFTLRMRGAELQFRAGRRAEALISIRTLEQQFPGASWLAAKSAALYAQAGMLDLAAARYAAARKTNADDEALRGQLASIYEKQHDAAHLRALYAEALQFDPADVDSMSRLARAESGLGNAKAAEADLRQAITLAPNGATIHAQLSDEFALAGDRSDSHAELVRAAALDTDSVQIQRQLDLDAGSAVADNDSAYLVDASQLASKVRQSAPSERANAVELADVRLVHVADNGLSTVRSQQVVYIANDQGARDYSTRNITYSPASQRLQVIRARVFKAGGGIVNADDQGDSGPTDAASAMYYDTQSRTLDFGGLHKGDVVELDYRILPSTNLNPYGDYFGELVTFGSSLPRKLQRYVLIAPGSLQLHVSEQRLGKGEEKTAGNEIVRSWEMKNLAPLPSEPRGPATTEVAPYVTVSTFGSWSQLGQWYAQLIAPQFKLDAALRDELSRLIAGKKTDEEKIRAIHHFVLRNTHYVALEFGVFSYKPYPVSQVYARRFGDCKDKASLMIALLRAAGIDADIALVRTRRMGDVDNGATAISVFNHAVAYIPKYDLWLDGTAEYAGPHELPIDDQGAQALTVSLDGQAQLRRIPVTLPMQNYTHRQVRAQVAPDGRIEFTGSTYTRGEDAPGLRRDYEVAERQRTSFSKRLAEVLPSVRVDNVEVNGAHDLESDVIVNFSGDLDSFAGHKFVTLTPSWMPRSYVQTLASLNSRREDLILPAPWTTEEELHFVLPAGARIESMPQDTNVETPFGSAVVRYHRDGNELVVHTSVQFRKLRVAPAEYAAFRDFCLQVENAFHNEIKVGL